MSKNNLSIFIGLIVLIISILGYTLASKAMEVNYNPNNDVRKLHFDNTKTELDFLNGAIKTTIEIVNPEKLEDPGSLYVTLFDANNKIATTGYSIIKLSSKERNSYEISLPTALKKGNLKNYKLEYSFTFGEKVKCMPNTKCVSKLKKITGSIPLNYSSNPVSLKIFSQDKFLAGSKAAIRIITSDPVNNNNLKDTDIQVSLLGKDEKDKEVLFSGKTNAEGTVNASLEIPKNKIGTYSINISAIPKEENFSVQDKNFNVQIVQDYKILLTTDKPIYQPNQTIKIRGLTLDTSNLLPVSDKKSVIEVFDAKGNKVFKKLTTSDKFGITSAEFTLADEVNMGTYKIRTSIGNVFSEKSINVSKYVLPKYKIAFKTDKEFYLPSETVKGSIDVNYFFGKPVKGAKVKIDIDKFDIGLSRIDQIQGMTDENGHFDFEAVLPDNFVGQNIANGNAVIKYNISVKDTADHTEEKTASSIVSEQPINILAIPESGKLSKNIENIVYLMTTYPDGTPAQTNVSGAIEGKPFSIKTDSTGIGMITIIPNKDQVKFKSVALDSRGNKAEKSFSLESNSGYESILLRTDKAISKVGDTIKLQALTTKTQGTIYFDIIKNGQTVLTDAMDINKGKAEKNITISSDLIGTIVVNAYIINKTSEIVRDNKIIYVNPAQELNIAVSSNKQMYKPGEDAVINFKVTDKNNHPILSALGIYIVDESVFALSEIQPGLEKVFFTLEEEILKPRFEIHGLSAENIIMNDKIKKENAENQQKTAKVLFSAAENIKDYSIKVDTYREELQKEAPNAYSKIYPLIDKINNAMGKYRNKHTSYPNANVTMETLLKNNLLHPSELVDPWNNKPLIIFINYDNNEYYSFIIISKGPDGKPLTSDDYIISQYGYSCFAIDLPDSNFLKLVYENPYDNNEKLKRLLDQVTTTQSFGRRGGFLALEDEMVMPMAVAGAGMPFDAEKKDIAVNKLVNSAIKPLPSKENPKQKEGDSQQEVRVRDYFPETLYTNPSLITDNNGNATMNVPMADSITSWRLSAMANSMNGLLGSNTYSFKVFQDFFIDIDLPVSLTQNDRISIPIAIYNYLPEKQTIKLKFQGEDWFESKDSSTVSLDMEANQVSVKYFTIDVKKLGNHTLTVYAYGSKMSDAIKRTILIEPDGKEFRDAINGRLDQSVTQTLNIPEDSIDDASKILVKLYPGYLSQVIEGMDKIFRMPSGCFEQTSSTTYPNILVLDYMKRTKQLTPEIQMKAESYINSGYQRLLTFEVPGGGFEWFGNAPANKILTAYGLMEFYDMSAVHEIDQNLISRTQNWLVNKQESDGSWKPDEGGIAEGAINQYKGNTLRTTAYVGWALASSNYSGDALDKAISYIKSNIGQCNDPYTLAVVGNILALKDTDSKFTDEIFTKLAKFKVEKDDTVYWETKAETPMYGEGKSATIETTALATIALINYGKDVSLTNKALNYLVKSKDSYGTWYSTQATILGMKALIMSLSDSTSKVDALVNLSINGKNLDSIKFDQSNSDVVRQIDLKNFTQKGNNKVTLSLSGKGSLLYQIVKVYYTPWKLVEKPKMPALSINVDYDKTTLAKNDTAIANVSVKNNLDAIANMIIVDLGIPPGFELNTEDFDKMVSNKVITKYSIAARQVILYFDKINANEKIDFKYSLKAKIPIKAQSGKSKVYKYYDPDVNAESSPKEMIVN